GPVGRGGQVVVQGEGEVEVLRHGRWTPFPLGCSICTESASQGAGTGGFHARLAQIANRGAGWGAGGVSCRGGPHPGGARELPWLVPAGEFPCWRAGKISAGTPRRRRVPSVEALARCSRPPAAQPGLANAATSPSRPGCRR